MNNDPFTPEPSTPPQQFGPQPEVPQQPAQQPVMQPVQQPVAQFDQPQPQPQFAQQPQQPIAQPPVGPGKPKKGLVIGLIVGAVVLAAGVTAFMLMQGGDKAPAGDSTTTDKNGSSEQGSGNTGSSSGDKATADNASTSELVKSLASKAYGVSGVMVLIPNSTPDTIEVAAVIESEVLSSTTLRALLSAIANGAGLSDIAKTKVSFLKSDGSVAAGANLPVAIDQLKIGASVVGTASDNTATFDIRKMRELLS